MRLCRCLAAVAIAALLAPAASGAPLGLNLAWDKCVGDGGGHNRTFACDTNAGSEALVLSFVPDSLFEGVAAINFTLQLSAESATLPDWWRLFNAGSCRPQSLLASPAPPAGSVECVDWASGNAALGIAGVNDGAGGSNASTVIQCNSAVSLDLQTTLFPGQEYLLGRLLINHAKTIGTGACAGCDVRMCILFREAEIGTVSRIVKRRADASVQTNQSVTWQNGRLIDYQKTCSPPIFPGADPRCFYNFGCALDQTTPARVHSWSAVKALYR